MDLQRRYITGYGSRVKPPKYFVHNRKQDLSLSRTANVDIRKTGASKLLAWPSRGSNQGSV